MSNKINQASTLFQHKHIKKGEYLFKDTDKEKYFYGIIKGKISIKKVRRKIKVLKKFHKKDK